MLRTILFLLLALGPSFRAIAGDQWRPQSTYAVIVGVLEWKNGLSSFSKEHRKDLELRDVLVERGVPIANIQVVLDGQATLSGIQSAVNQAVQVAPPESTLIIYYAGHGWTAGGDFFFANYDVEEDRRETAWCLGELGRTLKEGFRGDHLFLWADCCYSGGLAEVLATVASHDIVGFSLTSAGRANASTSNWTFTQRVIDGLRGDPLADHDGDGRIILEELDGEVKDAMRYLEGQTHGFQASGVPNEYVIARTTTPRSKDQRSLFPMGSYVRCAGRVGRVVGLDRERYRVEFYNYSDKTYDEFAESQLTLSTDSITSEDDVLDVGMVPDCEVEWHGTWWAGKVLENNAGRWRIHYVGYESSWDEWVGQERIRLK